MPGIKNIQYFCATFLNMKSRVIIILLTALVATSCGEYEKLLKSTDFALKKTKAKEYFDEGQYVKTTELLTQILPRYRATDEAEDLAWMNAQSYFGMKDYLMAGSEFTNFSQMYPAGQHAEEAFFMAAMCDYYQSPRPELDQQNTRNAIDGFSLFVGRFPSSTRIDEANRYKKELQEKLVEKSYLSAKLYYDMNQYKAAVTALTNSLKEYPETHYREEMMYIKMNCLFLYAENSIRNKQTERYQATLDDYYSFMEEFPKSTYSKEVSRIYQSTAKVLKINTDINKVN